MNLCIATKVKLLKSINRIYMYIYERYLSLDTVLKIEVSVIKDCIYGLKVKKHIS